MKQNPLIYLIIAVAFLSFTHPKASIPSSTIKNACAAVYSLDNFSLSTLSVTIEPQVGSGSYTVNGITHNTTGVSLYGSPAFSFNIRLTITASYPVSTDLNVKVYNQMGEHIGTQTVPFEGANTIVYDFSAPSCELYKFVVRAY
jgi:hypothetical protein